MSVYLALEILTIFIPLLFSYDRNLKFYPKLKVVGLSLILVGSLYIIGDIWFTKSGFWGFNEKYHSGIMIFNLPLEECLFFIVIPYASLFLHDTLVYLFPKAVLSRLATQVLSLVLCFSLLALVIFNLNKAYTAIYFSVALLSIIWAWISAFELLRRYYLTFCVILIPFFLVNSVLTGSFIAEPVVWYNNGQNLGIRIGTVPVEDISYAFSLILLNLIVVHRLIGWFNRNSLKG
jgi:lycopene cyclase domain-containing protein